MIDDCCSCSSLATVVFASEDRRMISNGIATKRYQRTRHTTTVVQCNYRETLQSRGPILADQMPVGCRSEPVIDIRVPGILVLE